MKILWILTSFVALASTVNAGAFRSIGFTRHDYAAEAETSAGKSVVEVRELTVEGSYPSGRPLKGDVVIVLDRPSGFFLWEFTFRVPSGQNSELLSSRQGNSLLYLDQKRIARFSAGPGVLFLRESHRRARTLDDAESQAIKELDEQREPLQANAFEKGRIEISSIGSELFSPTGSANFAPVKVISVSWDAEKLEVVLEGQWKERVLFNKQFKLVSADRLN